jgi:hypothetical protein
MAFTYYHLAALVISVTLLKWLRPNKLREIPVAGPSGILGSWISAVKFLTTSWSIDVIALGYKKVSDLLAQMPD